MAVKAPAASEVRPDLVVPVSAFFSRKGIQKILHRDGMTVVCSKPAGASHEQFNAHGVLRRRLRDLDAVLRAFDRAPQALLRAADPHPAEPLRRRLTFSLTAGSRS